jgi:hypothetical protein
MAAPVTPPVPRLRRWWWLAAAVVAVAVALIAWPRRDDAPRKRAAGGPAKVGPRLPWRLGPNGWQGPGRRRLGPIAIAPPADGLVRVTGTVVDRTSHKPVPDVEVVFADGTTEASAVADVAGRYSIDLPAGRYRPFVRGDGVMSAAPPVRERLPARPRPEQVAATRLELAPALDLRTSTDGVDLEVERSGKVHGKVVDKHGKPIAGAIVRAFATDDFGTARPVLGTDVAETDGAGGFQLEVAATTYRLDAFHDRYGGVTAYTMVAVNAGETAEAEITMQAGCVIAGRVVRADGRPVSDGALERGMSDSDAAGSYFPDGEFGEDGAFVWSTSEELTLFLRAWPWKSPPSQPRRFECTEGRRYDDVVFVIPNAAPDLSGRVVTADGRPVPFAFVDVGGESEGTMNQQERADADGNWAVYSLPPGQYRVASTADGVGAMVTHTSAPNHGMELRMSGTGSLTGKVAGVTDGSVTLTARQNSACATRRPRERDHVADVLDAGGVLDRALEAEAEAGVGHGAVAAQVAVPPVVLLGQAHLVHARVEHVEALLALAAADDLADAGRQHVHRGDGLAVVVLPHVEGLDVLRVVHHRDRALDDLLGEERSCSACRSMPHDTGNSNFLPLASRAP